MTEKQIQNALWTHLNDKGHRPVISNFTPPMWWECDMFSVTGAGYAQEFEIKVTKSDFKADASKTKRFYERGWTPRLSKHELLQTKSADGPSRFAYVVPEGLVAPTDIPDWAGLLEAYVYRKRIRIKVTKKAPVLHQHKVSDEVVEKIWKSFMWRYWALREKHYVLP